MSLDRWEWSPDRLTRSLETLEGVESVHLYLYLDVGSIHRPKDRRLTSNGDILSEIFQHEGSKVKTMGPMIFHDNTDPKGLYLEFHLRRYNEVKVARP